MILLLKPNVVLCMVSYRLVLSCRWDIVQCW